MTLKNNWVDVSPFGKLVLLGILMMAGTLIGLGAFYGINALSWGIGINDLSYLTLQTEPKVVWAAKFLQMFSQVGLFVIPAFSLAYLISNSPKNELGIKKIPSAKSVIIVLLITLLSIPFINLLAIWNSEIHLPNALAPVEDWMRGMQNKNDILMEVMLQMNSSKDILINLMMMVILPAIGEELIFRGVIQKQLLKWLNNPHVAIITTAAFFSAFHMQFLGFFSRMILGVIFGYFYYYSKNLWTAIWAHAINNGLALTLAIAFGANMEQTVMEEEPTLSFTITSIIGFGIATFLLYSQKRNLTN